jgi:hypothetical protein
MAVFDTVVDVNSLLEKLVFFTGKYNIKIPNLNRGRKDHSIILDKINFDMSVVISLSGVVSLIGKVWTI